MEADMTTLRARTLVSLSGMATLTLALGVCAGTPPRTAPDAVGLSEAAPVTIRFDNLASDYVHVYLISDRRQWLLGRVEPGATARLRIPDVSVGEGGFVQLAVLTGERVTLQAATNPRANITVAQPRAFLLSQEWRYAQGQVIPLALSASGGGSRPW
jgi:hypothetical protein